MPVGYLGRAGLDGSDALIASCLAALIHEGESNPGIARLASMCLTSKRTVRRRLRALERRGMLRVLRQPLPRANSYEFVGALRQLGVQKEFGPDE